MRFSSKFAQVSIFVIIGVILLFLGIFYFAYQSDSLPVFRDQTNAFRVGEFVEGCMVSVLDDGITRIGLSGGWLYNEYRDGIYARYDSESYLVQLARGFEDPSGTRVPYWFHFNDNSQEFVLDIPELDSSDRTSMRMQLQRYLDENLEGRCLNGLSIFDEMFDISYRPSDISHRVEFDQRRNSIRVSLDLPITIQAVTQDSTEFIRQFSVEEENPLTVPYHLARDIVLAQSEFSFVENNMLYFLSAYQSSAKGNKGGTLPPFFAYELHYDMDPWFVSDVKELIQAILTVHLQRIRLLETANTRQSELPENISPDNALARGILSVGENYYISSLEGRTGLDNPPSFSQLTESTNPRMFREFSNYEVRPVYDPFLHPMYFNLHGSLGNYLLLPNPEFYVSFVPVSFTSYSSRYELTTPVVFEIEDTQNSNSGFIFRIAVEANIDHNEPLADSIEFREEISDLLSALNSFSFDNPNEGSLICDPVQFISGLITLNITDPVNHGSILEEGHSVGIGPDAFVEFDCKGITTCNVGMTEFDTRIDSTREVTALGFRLPTNCNPGTLRISKPGYKTLEITDIDPSFDQDLDLGEFEMPSMASFNLSVRLLRSEESTLSVGNELSQNSTGFLIFYYFEESSAVQVIEITHENQYDLTVDLFPGPYRIVGFVSTEEGILIPEERKCVSGPLGIGQECFTIPEIDMEQWIKAAIQVEEFEIEIGNFRRHSTLVVPLTAERLPTNFDEFERAANALGQAGEGVRMPYFQ